MTDKPTGKTPSAQSQPDDLAKRLSDLERKTLAELEKTRLLLHELTVQGDTLERKLELIMQTLRQRQLI